MHFADRVDAGRRLAARLHHLRDEPVVVLGLPRGGVPVAAEVARALAAPLDVIIVRKLGVPFQPELGMGAIGEGGARVVNDEVIRRAGVSGDELAHVEARERTELERRARRFRGDRPSVDLDGRTAVIVDDGIATGSTARAACQVARARGAARVVLAVPVAPPGWEASLADVADELVALDTPEPFWAIGRFYTNFAPTTDQEVLDQLERNHRRTVEVEARVGKLLLPGSLTMPSAPVGVVVFAHGSGSSRFSPRNREVADVLHRAGLATLLFDLLTADEAHDRSKVFDVAMLASRLVEVTEWLRSFPEMRSLPIGYFGASTGAAAALLAAADQRANVFAVVSRGGRPDLAMDQLSNVRAPTLLVVGGDDHVVLGLNRRALAELRCEADLAVVPGAGHLFEEPGTLQAAADLARRWFVDHLPFEGRSDRAVTRG